MLLQIAVASAMVSLNAPNAERQLGFGLGPAIRLKSQFPSSLRVHQEVGFLFPKGPRLAAVFQQEIPERPAFMGLSLGWKFSWVFGVPRYRGLTFSPFISMGYRMFFSDFFYSHFGTSEFGLTIRMKLSQRFSFWLSAPMVEVIFSDVRSHSRIGFLTGLSYHFWPTRKARLKK